MAISTFCFVLSEVNNGNTAILDTLPTNFTNYNKLIIKECTTGRDGDLLKYSNMYSESSLFQYNTDIRSNLYSMYDYLYFLGNYTAGVAAPSFTAIN